MRITPRGLSVISALLANLAAVTFFKDLPLLLVSLTLAAVLLADLVMLRARLASHRRAVPESLEVRCRAGAEHLVRLSRCPPEEKVTLTTVPWAFMKRLEDGCYLLLRPPLAGVWRTKPLKVIEVSPLRFFEEGITLPLELVVKAYPRVVPVLAEVATILARGYRGRKGRAERGTAFPTPPVWTEPAWVREYVPGDPLKLVDWKATARKLSLHVKTFYGSAEPVFLVVNLDAHGPYTMDWTLARALSFAIGAYRRERSLELLLIEGGSLKRASARSPFEVLAELATLSLERLKSSLFEAFSLIPPTLSEVEKILEELGFREGPGDFRWSSIGEVRREVANGEAIVFVGPLTTNTETVLELLSLGGKGVAASPPMPWLDARDPLEAFRVYVANERARRKVIRLGKVLV